MVKTKLESERTGERTAAERRQRDQAVLRRYNERQVSEMKYTRQVPVSGAFVMEVRKTIGGGASNGNQKEEGAGAGEAAGS